MERFGVDSPKIEGCFRFSGVTSSIPGTGRLSLAGGLSWGRRQQRKGSGLEGLQNHTWRKVPAVTSSASRRSTTQHLRPLFAVCRLAK